MNKYIKYLIITLIIIGVIFGINYLLTPSMDTQIENYLIKKGYSKTNIEKLLEKQESSTKKYSFSTATYTFMMELEENQEELTSSLNATYDFTDESLIYSYRIGYKDSLNVLFKGSYNDGNFVCEKEFSTATLSSNNKELFCSLAKTNIELFDLEANTLFKNYKLINYMKK